MKLDVRDLPPPQPFVNIMQALHSLSACNKLLVHIHREPFPLYDVLREEGYEWMTSAHDDDSFQILIFRPA